jgi:ribosomal protein S18 acetylase RimI-like enzyme
MISPLSAAPTETAGMSRTCVQCYPPVNRELRPLRARDCRAAAFLLARAFRDNPASLALIDAHNAERREQILRRVFRGFIEATLRYGEATLAVTGSAPVGVSLVFRPGQYPYSAAAKLWLSYGPLSSGPRIAYRYALADAYLSRWHPPGAQYYLFVLGVDPAAQGRGHGGALLDGLNALADRDGLPCYLEADREDNVRLYERYGYRVTREGIVRRAQDLKIWTMTRPAA